MRQQKFCPIGVWFGSCGTIRGWVGVCQPQTTEYTEKILFGLRLGATGSRYTAAKESEPITGHALPKPMIICPPFRVFRVFRGLESGAPARLSLLPEGGHALRSLLGLERPLRPLLGHREAVLHRHPGDHPHQLFAFR
jgi:hypothetical protein